MQKGSVNQSFITKNFRLQDDLKLNTKQELKNAVTNELIDLGIFISSQETLSSKGKSTVKIEVIYNNSSRVNYITEKINKIFADYKSTCTIQKSERFRDY
ncbi:hypothetical protein ACOBV8_00050 [Pseudoalteromonas espejiana]